MPRGARIAQQQRRFQRTPLGDEDVEPAVAVGVEHRPRDPVLRIAESGRERWCSRVVLHSFIAQNDRDLTVGGGRRRPGRRAIRRCRNRPPSTCGDLVVKPGTSRTPGHVLPLPGAPPPSLPRLENTRTGTGCPLSELRRNGDRRLGRDGHHRIEVTNCDPGHDVPRCRRPAMRTSRGWHRETSLCRHPGRSCCFLRHREIDVTVAVAPGSTAATPYALSAEGRPDLAVMSVKL